MANADSPTPWDKALAYVWGAYRTWALTSRRDKARLAAWRRRVLALAIAGAVLGALCELSTTWGLDELRLSWLTSVLGVLSGTGVALATYFGRQQLTSANERRWVRARATAEALKSEAHLYLTRVAPYHAEDAPVRIVDEVDTLQGGLLDLAAAPVTDEEKRARLPEDGPWSAAQYAERRVKEQIAWYTESASTHEVQMERARQWSFWLGAAGVVLGVVGGFYPSAAILVAVITTVTTAIASYVYAERFEYLVVSYRATAQKLEARLARWEVTPGGDPASFVLACEEIMRSENSAWMTERTREQPGRGGSNADGPADAG